MRQLAKRLAMGVVRRLGAVIGGFAGGYIMLSPEQTATLEAAAVVVVGVLADALVFDREG